MAAPRIARILVVEDDLAKRYVIARSLKNANFEVIEATTGGEGLRLAELGTDLVVLDVGLPDINGLEVCRTLKQNPATAKIPVLQMSTTFVEIDDRVTGLESGADAYLTNVSGTSELIATIKALLRMRQAEEATRELAQQWQTTFDALSDSVCLLDASGKIVRCNRSLCTLLGKSAAEVVEQAVEDAFPPTLLGAYHAGAAKESLGKPQEYQHEDHWYRFRADPVLGEADKLAGLVCIVTDISDRKRAEESLKFLANAGSLLGSSLADYESTLQKVVRLAVPYFADWCIVEMFDDLGAVETSVVAHMDGAMEDLVQAFRRCFPAEGTRESFPAISRKGADEWLAQLKPQASASQEVESRPAESKPPASEETVSPRELLETLQPQSVIAVPIVIRHRIVGAIRFFISPPRRMYAQSDLILGGELAGRAAIAIENAQLYRALKDADRRKDEFLAMLAHELRNPLAPIRSAVDLLILGASDAEVVAMARDSIDRQVQQVTRLVDDLLDVSRIMQGKILLRTAPVEIATIVNRAIEIAQPLIDSQGHALTIDLPDEPIWLEGDLIRLAQVVSNLLNNAAKYTESGGRVRLSAAREGENVLVAVSDSGIGIDPAMLPKVFEPFTQADRSIERSQGGLGIGLTLVRTLVQMHGGSVQAKSAGRGLGSEFSVRLPALSSPPASTEVVSDLPPEAVRRRVLVVDDNRGAAYLLAQLLTKLGDHEVSVAHDGADALQVARTIRPDLILLDIGLPSMSGYEVARHLRQQPVFKDTLLVALSGYGQEDDRIQSHSAGIDEHLVKPASLDSLRNLFRHPKLRRK